jgi:hypothetical protein
LKIGDLTRKKLNQENLYRIWQCGTILYRL